MKRIDAGKMFLMQADVDNMAKFKTKVDDQIQNETFELFDLSNELITRRIAEKEAWYKEALSKPFDYKVDEEYVTLVKTSVEIVVMVSVAMYVPELTVTVVD